MNKEWSPGFVQKKVKVMYHLQNGLCGLCGTPNMFLRAEVSASYYKSFKHFAATFDHILAKSHGGTLAYSNGVCACNRCNTIKGDLSIEEFFEQYDVLFKRLIERPQRIAARRLAMVKKNGYIIAWLAAQLGETVEDLFLKHVYTQDEILEMEKAA